MNTNISIFVIKNKNNFQIFIFFLMKKIFFPDFELNIDNFTIKYLTLADVCSISKYYLSNFSHFKNSLPKRSKDFYAIDNIYNILENEIFQREKQIGLRLYIIDNGFKNKENLLINEHSSKLEEIKIIGDISLYNIGMSNYYAAISYEIDKDYASKGIMSKVFNHLLDYLHSENSEDIFLKQLVSFVPIDNGKSKQFCLNNKFEYFTKLENYAEINGKIKNHFVFIKNLDIF